MFAGAALLVMCAGNYPQPIDSFQATDTGFQPLTAGAFNLVLNRSLYFGSPAIFNRDQSSFQPQSQGMYWVDEQVQLRGKLQPGKLKAFIQLNYNGKWYLKYEYNFIIPDTDSWANPIRIMSQICMAPGDHVEAYVYVDQPNVYISGEESQFEGRSTGFCTPGAPNPGYPPSLVNNQWPGTMYPDNTTTSLPVLPNYLQ